MIQSRYEDNLMEAMRKYFNKNLPDTLYETHYDLSKNAIEVGATPVDWKEFLMRPEVSEFKVAEANYLKDAEMGKILKNISDNPKSTGIAATLSILDKLSQSRSTKEGPPIIYGFIDVNEQEKHSPNFLEIE